MDLPFTRALYPPGGERLGKNPITFNFFNEALSAATPWSNSINLCMLGLPQLASGLGSQRMRSGTLFTL
jgi:hypothetical protein